MKVVVGGDIRSRIIRPDHYLPYRSGDGFTLVELIVVMVLIGILGALGAARFFDRKTFDAASFAEQTAAILRFAQKEAIAQNRPVFVQFSRDSIALCFASGDPCSATGLRVQAPFSNGSLCTSTNWYCLSRPAAVTYTVSLGDVSSTTRWISFDALGRPLDSNGAGLNAAMTLDVSASPSSVRLFVEPETGYVHQQ